MFRRRYQVAQEADVACEWAGLQQAARDGRFGVFCVKFTEKRSGKGDHLHRAACLASFYVGWIVNISNPDPQTAIVWFKAAISEDRDRPRVPVLDQDSKWVQEWVEAGEHGFKSAQRYAKMPEDERKVYKELMKYEPHLSAAERRARSRRLNTELQQVRARHAEAKAAKRAKRQQALRDDSPAPCP